MQKSDSIGALMGALAKAQGAMRSASKDAVNPHFRNSYATLSSLWDVARGPLAANGLAFTQTVQGDQLVSILGHSSGEFLASEYPIKPVKLVKQKSSGGEFILVEQIAADPQSVGSAISYARRYSMQSMLGLAADDDSEDDGNRASGRGVEPVRPAPAPMPAKKPTAPVVANTDSSEFIPGAGKLKGRKLGERGLIELEQYAQELKTLEPGKLSAAAVTVLTQVEAEIAKRKTTGTETESFEIFRG